MKQLIDLFNAQSLDSFVDYVSFGRKAKKEIDENKLTIVKKLKIALLASSTVNGVKEIMFAQCCALNVYADLYLAEYGQYAQEIYNPKSGLYAANPDLIIINIDIRTIATDYFFLPYNRSISERKDWVSETVHFLSGLAIQAAEKASSKIILHNLEVPDYSSLGILENKEEYGYVESIEDVNKQLRDVCKHHNQIFLYDYNAFCARVGKENILDAKMYYIGDIKLKPQNLPLLCEDYVCYANALAGCTKKCIVLDLDNTLWGGVVGESGLEGIHLGPTPEGRPFLEFQKYLYALCSRGIILAINSKNNEKDAFEVLRNHPHMVLKEKHFAAMRINWDDKVANMKSLALEISIGLDSFVFIDDDQMNRKMIQQFLPEVFVVELPKDPSLYVNTLTSLNVFDSLILTEEDKNKGGMYHAEKERKAIKQTATNLTDYLRMLNIKVYIEKANKNNSPRIAQLTQKTNQFNTTTRRYTEESIFELSENSSYRVIALRLVDKFGDYGLTGVAIIDSNQSNSWRIDTFLLSCRILGRNAENVLLAYIVQQAKKENIKFVYGEFIPSKKNIPANEFYKNNNFEKINVKEDIELWEYNCDDEYLFPEFIKCEVEKD